MGAARRIVASLAACAAVAATWGGLAPAEAEAPRAAAAAAAGGSIVVSPTPTSTTPAINDGQDRSIAQIGNTMVLGGTFTSVTSTDGTTYSRSGVVAFDATTGKVSTAFDPKLNKAVVESVEPGPTAGTVYVAGAFTQLNGATASHVVLLNVATGQPVSGFAASTINANVTELAVARGQLIIGGIFTKVGGVAHAGFASLSPTTGKVTSYMNLQVAEQHNNSGSGASAPPGVFKFDVSPDGTRLAAIGNFRKVDGLDRDQLVVASLSSTSASVSSDWQTNRFKPLCYSWAYASYVRDVDFSPDSSYFVVASTGGYGAGTLCDAAARFETAATGSDIQPTWVDSTGGDTLYSAEVTDTAVYVGGHNRWMNNSLASDRIGAGAVPRPGISALAPETGVPFRWNPGRNPRGAATFDLLSTSQGLWVASDTDYIGNYRYKRPRIALFPPGNEYPPVSESTAALPGTVYVGGASSSRPLQSGPMTTSGVSGLSTVSPGPIDWSQVRGSFLAGGRLYYGLRDGTFRYRTFDGTTYGSEVTIQPWIDSYWNGVKTGSGSTTYDGAASDFYGELRDVTGMTFSRHRIYYTVSGSGALYWRWFNAESGIVGSDRFTASSSSLWASTGGLLAVGNTLYYVLSNDGSLRSVDFTDGIPNGTSTTLSAPDMRGRGLFLASSTNTDATAPTASFTADCSGTTCNLNASASRDDNAIASYAWDFGDGATGAGITTSHDWGSSGTRTVTLTVTDTAGNQGTATRQVQLVDTATDISFVAGNSVGATRANPSITIPSSVRAGDTVLLSVAMGSDPGIPTPSGWTLVGTKANSMASYVWRTTATSSTPGSTVSLNVPSVTKWSLSATAYRGLDPTTPVSGATSATDISTATHTSPGLSVPSGSWVVSIFTDKGPSTSAWTEPAGTERRAASFTTSTGGVSSLVVDGGGGQSGSVGGLTARTDATSARGITWTIGLTPAP